MKCPISSALLERLRHEAEAEHGREICGLLTGRGGAIEEAVPIANAAADPRSAFLLDPASHLRASRAAREAGRAVVGHYHSHPRGSADPSPADAAEAGEQGLYWLILTSFEARLWISRRGGQVLGAFDPVEIARF